MSVFVQAGPAEILRAVQKDRIFCVTIEQRISDIVRAFSGNNAWLKHRSSIQILSQILYYSSTTLCGYQTLGEEYTSIVQVDHTLRHVPSFLRRALMIALESGGMTVMHNLLLKIQKEINKNQNITNETKYKLSVILSSVRDLLPFFQHMHHALFYWRGIYYDTIKRFLTIRYIKMQPWLQNHQSLYGFKILSIVTGLHLFIFGVRTIIRWKPNKPQEVIECPAIVDEVNKCPLCLETRLETSATTCGHLFCWNCILDWLQENQQCPLCREPITSSRIIPLSNYS